MACQSRLVPAVAPLAAMLHLLLGPALLRPAARSSLVVATEMSVVRWIFEAVLDHLAVLVACASLLATLPVVALGLVLHFRPVPTLFLPVDRFALMPAPVRKVQVAKLVFPAATALKAVAATSCCAVVAASQLRVAVSRLLRLMVMPQLVLCRSPRARPQLDRVGTFLCQADQLPVVLPELSLLALALPPPALVVALL